VNAKWCQRPSSIETVAVHDWFHPEPLLAPIGWESMRTRGLPALSMSRFQLVPLFSVRRLPTSSGQLTRRLTLTNASTVRFVARSRGVSATVAYPPSFEFVFTGSPALTKRSEAGLSPLIGEPVRLPQTLAPGTSASKRGAFPAP
jgi:hypothetical protein